MNKDLVASNLHRQNVLNNSVALRHIESDLNLGGINFKGETVFVKSQIATIFDVDERTIDRYIADNSDELKKNGYHLLQGDNLREFKSLSLNDINVAQPTKSLGIFSFKAMLNIAMLLTESEKAKFIRSKILEIVMHVITQKAGDKIYINQRDSDYLPSAFQEENYRKEFTDAIDTYIDNNNNWKYAHYTDAVYKAIFVENAKEYRKILNLQNKHKTRDTFYAEILDLIASFEAGFTEELKEKCAEKQEKLSSSEANELFKKFSSKAIFKPLINKARTLMASRDLSLRDALHEKLQNYIQAMPESDYEKFLGEKSKNLQEHIDESLEVYKRLKDR